MGRGMFKCSKIGTGQYMYRGFRITNCGYYPPDKQVWWEAVDIKTECADFHAETKRLIKKMIDESIEREDI